MYAALASEKDNLFFSPASIAVALTMAYAGAKGETAREIADVLHLPDLEPARLHAALGFLIGDLTFEKVDDEADEDPVVCQVKMANALWGRRGLGYLDAYLHVLRSFYQSELREVDFADPEGARRIINAWVSAHTNGKIPELLSQGALSELANMVLTNAVYFKARWREQFEEDDTRDQPFYLDDGTTTTVEMMRQTEEFRYAEDELFQVLELPYRGARFAMLIALPRGMESLGALTSELSVERLCDWREDLDTEYVDVWLPKFTQRQPLSLTGVLQGLGIRLAFDEAADFSGMANVTPLMIDQVLHEAFISVDEQGTEAAAATATMMILGEPAGPEDDPVQFHADHPFLYAIVERQSGAVLFLGRMQAP